MITIFYASFILSKPLVIIIIFLSEPKFLF